MRKWLISILFLLLATTVRAGTYIDRADTLPDSANKSDFYNLIDNARPIVVADDDADTKIQVEEAADEDKVRIDTGGTERALISGTATEAYIQVNAHKDADGDTKVQVEESADEDLIRFDIGGTEQVVLEDGSIYPTTDNDIDLGDSTHEFKDLYLDGIAYIDEARTDAIKIGTANQGDVFYDNGTATTRLTPGTAGQFLKTGGAAANPAWSNLVTAGARAYMSADQDIANNSATKVEFDTETYDIGSDWDTDNDKFVTPVAGYYLVTANLYFLEEIGDQKVIRVFIYVDSAAYSSNVTLTSVATTGHQVAITDVIYVAASKDIEIYVYQNNGDARQLDGSECYVAVVQLSL